jgi:hypothetical protein
MREISYILAMLAISGIAGCASPQPQVRVVRVHADTYCLNTEKQSYVPIDTPKTIDGVRRSERKRACLCEKPKPANCG